MRRLLCGPLAITTALCALPTQVLAAGPPPEGEDDVVVVEDEMEGETPAEGPKGDAPAGIDDVLGEEGGTPQLGAGEPAAATDEKGKKVEKDSEEKLIKTETKLINVIQRQRMLKKKRVDLQPQVGISVNDPYVRHYAFGLEVRYWLTNRMALGLNGTGMVANRTPRYDNIKIQEGLLLTANKVLWQASLNFQYNPFYGKIAIFNRLLLHWEAFIQVGGGAMQTQVIPRYEAIHDPYNVFTGGGYFTIGGQTYLPRVNWFSFNIAARTWIYPDKLEPINRGPNMNLGDRPELDDPDAAKDASKFTVQFNTVLFLGFSFYLPSSFEYTTPR